MVSTAHILPPWPDSARPSMRRKVDLNAYRCAPPVSDYAFSEGGGTGEEPTGRWWKFAGDFGTQKKTHRGFP